MDAIEGDVDGTANRVASVTLESDSLSEAPKSFHNKRRKKISRKEKLTQMDVDYASSSSPSFANNASRIERGKRVVPMTSDFSSSDSTHNNSSSHEEDADDEQSDWPGAIHNSSMKYCTKCVCKQINRNTHQDNTLQCDDLGDMPTTSTCYLHQNNLYISNPTCTFSSACRNSNKILIKPNVVRLIEKFLSDQHQSELELHQIYKISPIKKMVRGNPPIQIIKRGRGTIILKK